MLRAPLLPQSTRSPQPAPDRRGITALDVDRAADNLLRAGQRPTIERVRASIGRGSPNTINPLLDAWWSRLAGRLDAGPAALHRLPEPVLLAAEGLWLQTLNEARKRAATEQGTSKSALARDRQELEVRSHVLSIRESELQSRLEQSERRTGQLELEVAALTTMLRKEQASRLAAEHRLVPDERAPHPRRRGGGRATLKSTAAKPPTSARATRVESRAPARPSSSVSPRKATTKPPRSRTTRPRTRRVKRR